ncbi:unnamed protein product [Pleuronectes platessa]|uniref:Uncharacterized protein n=1 Tax=Pleuronectes platessa TaxID=8262 RepID=A0A9N7U2N0_PLEPL|nr:unnamed protein product [Pleuronectes platessa]
MHSTDWEWHRSIRRKNTKKKKKKDLELKRRHKRKGQRYMSRCETRQFLVMVCKEASHMLAAAAGLSGARAQAAENSCGGDTLRPCSGWNKLSRSGHRLQLIPFS